MGDNFRMPITQNKTEISTKRNILHTIIDVRKGVLGGLTPPPPLRLKIWAPPLENFRAGDPLKHLLGGLGGR